MWQIGDHTFPMLDEHRECIESAEPVIRAVLDELLPNRPDLVPELAVAGCVGFTTWQHDPDDLPKLRTIRATIDRLERQYRELRPGTRGAVGPWDLDELLDEFKASLERAITRGPRRARQRPPNRETELVLRLWSVLRANDVAMRVGARIIAAIFILLGTVETLDDPEKAAETIYQRIRNATLR